MQDAVSGTEAIRTWTEHKIGVDALCKQLNTNKDTGMTEAAAEAHPKAGMN